MPKIEAPDDVARTFATLWLGPDDVDLIGCGDATEILHIGGWGLYLAVWPWACRW